MHTADELTERFRASGRKVTPQRQCIFRLLQGNVEHPSAETVYEGVRAEMPTVSLKTVYQTLHELAEMGELATLDLGTGTVRFDPHVEEPHHHLVCRACGKIRDARMAVPSLEVPAGERQGFELASAEVVFRGLCPDCRRSAGQRPAGRGEETRALQSAAAGTERTVRSNRKTTEKTTERKARHG